jgi:hypothetical protein
MGSVWSGRRDSNPSLCEDITHGFSGLRRSAGVDVPRMCPTTLGELSVRRKAHAGEALCRPSFEAPSLAAQCAILKNEALTPLDPKRRPTAKSIYRVVSDLRLGSKPCAIEMCRVAANSRLGFRFGDPSRDDFSKRARVTFRRFHKNRRKRIACAEPRSFLWLLVVSLWSPSSRLLSLTQCNSAPARWRWVLRRVAEVE